MKTRTDLGLVREVLDLAAATSGHHAAQVNGLAHRTVYRWIAHQQQEPAWPTDEDIRAHRAAAVELGPRRAHDAAVQASYKKRRYLARGALMTVPALGTTRRVQALYALGWTSTQLAERLGVTPARIGHLSTTGRQDRVLVGTAEKVAALYDELCMTIPRDPDRPAPKHCRVHDRQRRLAARHGWPPPLAWDDIDDPDEQPVAWQYAPAARGELLDELVARGAGLTEACAALHVSPLTLQRWTERHGRRADYVRLAARESPTRDEVAAS